MRRSQKTVLSEMLIADDGKICFGRRIRIYVGNRNVSKGAINVAAICFGGFRLRFFSTLPGVPAASRPDFAQGAL